MALLTLMPADRDLALSCEVAWSIPTVARVELAANVVLFVPPALLAVAATRRPLRVLIAGSGLSAAIEVIQALVPGLGRACSTSDWLSNTIGVVIGAFLGWLALLLARRRSAPADGSARD